MFEFKEDDLTTIARALNVPVKKRGATIRYELGKAERGLALEIYPDIPIGKRRGNLVCVFTNVTHLQLHFCTGYVVDKAFGDVTFVGETNGKLCGLTIEKQGGCSLYANIDREILSGDFTNLGPEIMLSGIALSLTETILPEPAPSKKNPIVEQRPTTMKDKVRKKVQRGKKQGRKGT
jgi:hypothetical protein